MVLIKRIMSKLPNPRERQKAHWRDSSNLLGCGNAPFHPTLMTKTFGLPYNISPWNKVGFATERLGVRARFDGVGIPFAHLLKPNRLAMWLRLCFACRSSIFQDPALDPLADQLLG